MKASLIILFLICSFPRINFAQSIVADKLPTAVIKKFNHESPVHKFEKWISPSSGIYVVTFYSDSAQSNPQRAKYDMEGKWWERQREIAYSELTAEIKLSITEVFGAVEIKTVMKFETRYNNNSVWYSVAFVTHSKGYAPYKQLITVSYSPDGKSSSIMKSAYIPNK